MSLSARVVLHGTLPFEPALIDAVLAEIPPAELSVNGIEMWDHNQVRLALCVRSGIKAAFFDAAEVDDVCEFFSEDDGDHLDLDEAELAEVEAMEAENDEGGVRGIQAPRCPARAAGIVR